MSATTPRPYAATFRDVLACITAYLHTADIDSPPDDPVHGLMDDVILANPEHAVPVFVGLISALITELAAETGTTRELIWQDLAARYALGLDDKEDQ